ncbi:hypothetical protein KIP88_02510 [Bradyrhizobium sp. SRL28]|uniref:hypothetical protein n=1 Tax=Bradyrhizobium sp. SRL28 TaxID=2836178 RepID=UPI001BDF2DDE|nr:hypothetical protein [Bradyrhizobium sp. SRL28]MBT1509362.1 hypothetical protein [Bradyrhizobium sp. SRL28]
MKYAKGDNIEVTCEGRTADGVVIMASENGLSLMIGFDAMFGGHLGMMPVTMRDGVSGYSIIDGTEIVLKKVARQ